MRASARTHDDQINAVLGGNTCDSLRRIIATFNQQAFPVDAGEIGLTQMLDDQVGEEAAQVINRRRRKSLVRKVRALG